MKTLFALFETDVHGTKSSRIFLGIFSTKKLAELFAQKNRINSTISNALILEVEVNHFGQI